MTETNLPKPDRLPVGNLTDFVTGVEQGNPLAIEVVVNQKDGRVMVFHDKPFQKQVSWFEYDLNTSKLDFVMDSGDVRNAGMPITPAIAKYMQNTHQILMILMNKDTGEATEGAYVPVIIHRT